MGIIREFKRVCFVFLFTVTLVSCGKIIAPVGTLGQNIVSASALDQRSALGSEQPAPPVSPKESQRDNGEYQVQPQGSFGEGVYVQVKGLSNPQPVLLTVKDSKGHIVGTLQTNYNKKINLNSLDLREGESYTVAAESKGYRVSEPKTIEVGSGNLDEETIFSFEKIESNLFRYHWESDLANREYEYSSHVPEAVQIEFLNEVVNIPNHAAAQTLQDKHNIVLSNEGEVWTLDYVNRLFRTVNGIPHYSTRKAKFILKDEFIANDIRIQRVQGNNIVYISTKAFNNAEPRMVRLNGVKGRFFSRRLFHALVRFYTNSGANRRAVEKILNDKFGLTLQVPNIRRLTGESPHNFQSFQNNEVMSLLTALAEMPEGYYKIPGFRYLLRRQNGHPHPLYPGAPAVAWPRGPNSDSYVEFMDTAFRGNYSMSYLGINNSEDYVHRLIVHEKTHFIWSNVLSQQTRDEWTELAGWYRNENDPDGWSNRYTTSFVSPYAHLKNPNEDFAETISYYILNPNRLLSVSPEKFDFVQKRIMNGYRYIAQVREDLQFEVLNLFPDYDYPGKIKRVDVYAHGDHGSDKRVIVEIELLNREGFQDGANWARTRLYSENDTFVDMYLYPVNGNNHILRGQVTIPAHAKSGYWKTQQITVEDEVGNIRMEGIDDFGFKLYINNSVEDTIAPKYIKDSLQIQVEPTTLSGRPVHRVRVSWFIEENMKMRANNGVFVNFVSLDYPEAYAIQEYGNVNLRNNRAEVTFYVTEYFPSGRYTVAYLNMQDAALNYGTQYFSNNPSHEKRKIVHIETANHDRVKPTLDLNRISVSARPTNPDRPDGQTEVTITYYAKDDKSGLDTVSYYLIDPTGKSHHGYHYHSNFYTVFFAGNPTVYKKYVIHHVLPRGSAPGTWGLREMTLNDKGGNSKNYNFVEILHFSVD